MLYHLPADGAPLPGAMSETISGKGFAISGKQAIFTTETERKSQSATEKHSRIRRSDRHERLFYGMARPPVQPATPRAKRHSFLLGALRYSSFCLCVKNRLL